MGRVLSILGRFRRTAALGYAMLQLVLSSSLTPWGRDSYPDYCDRADGAFCPCA